MHKGLSVEGIPVSGPSITSKEIAYVTDAVTNAWYKNANSYNERFEKQFADYVNRRYAISLPSATAGLHLSLLALGIGQGDEVIVPEITWLASAAPVSYVGATPVFADVDPQTWCLSAESFEACITPLTKAVIPVDLYGNLPDMDAILATARRHGVAVIEDAAEAIGSEYKGKKAGSFGETSVFSFHGSKTLTTGEGGMVVTDRRDLYDRMLVLRDHGRKPGDKKMFWNYEIGHKYKMSCLQAALGLAQLERIDELVASKRQIFAWYCRGLRGLEGILLNCEEPHIKNTYWMVTVILDEKYGIRKEHLIERMGRRGIACRPFFYPLSSLPAYEHLSQAHQARQRNKVCYRISPYGMNVPSGVSLTEEDVSCVCGSLRDALSA